MDEDEKNKDIDVVSGDGTEIEPNHTLAIVIPKEIKSNKDNDEEDK